VAEKKIPIATDSAAELHELIGDDATATFESDPNFVDSNPTADASSEHITLRDTDDTEDSEEEEDEEGSEDEDDDDIEDEDDDDDDEDEDDDDEYEDDEEEDDPEVLRTAEPTNVHGPGKRSKTDIERELEEMEDENAGDEGIDAPEDENGEEEKDDEEFHVQRGVDAALRMRANGPGAQA
jgi:hypothetical protein